MRPVCDKDGWQPRGAHKTCTGRKGGGGVDSRRSGHHVCACACTRMSVCERMGLDIRELIQAAKTAVHFINMHERVYSSTYGKALILTGHGSALRSGCSRRQG